jgi:hypothetical protein
MCKAVNAQPVQPTEQEPPRELDNNTCAQIYLNTYYEQSLCIRKQKFTFKHHNICLLCYRSLDKDFANLHLLTIIHFIAVYTKPPFEYCEICDSILTKFKINRCRRCVHHYRNYINEFSREELTEFYNSSIPLAITYKEIHYKIPSMHD